MAVTYHTEVVQGSDEWLELRRGILTASEMKRIITPTLKFSRNADERTHMYELMAQRLSGFVEPSYISDDMLRGQEDEIQARLLYSEHFAPVQEVGFITNDDYGFPIGYSPDGLVGEDGLIECKSRRQKYQVQTILKGGVPSDYVIQIQTGLLVSHRKWCDFISFSGGFPLVVVRVLPDGELQEAIVRAATDFEKRLSERMDEYEATLAMMGKLIPTERYVEKEIMI